MPIQEDPQVRQLKKDYKGEGPSEPLLGKGKTTDATTSAGAPAKCKAFTLTDALNNMSALWRKARLSPGVPPRAEHPVDEKISPLLGQRGEG